MALKRSPSFTESSHFSGLPSRKALFHFIREFIEKSALRGSYWEFGVFNGESMKEAYFILREHVHHYIGFDSFQGLPEPKGVDLKALKHTPHFVKGNYRSISKKFVSDNIHSGGMPMNKLKLFPGLFKNTLVLNKYKGLLKDTRALPAVIHIDADFYESTKQVLDFIAPLVQTGCWLLFDDYWCYGGSSRYGTQRAIRDFLTEHPEIRIQEYCSYRGWSKAFIAERLEDESEN